MKISTRGKTMKKIITVGVIATVLLSSCAFIETADEKRFEPQAITPELAEKYAIYAMMASNAYHDEKSKPNIPLKSAGWILVDENGKETSNPTKEYFTGLAYDIYEKYDSNEVVFAIRGTDGFVVRDFMFANLSIGLSPQYEEMNEAINQYIEHHPNKKIVATGHSLGGGLSLGVSVHCHYGDYVGHTIDAVTFDASPRIFDGIGDHHQKGNRTVIYQEGEILEFVRTHWKKLFEVVPKENIYKTKFELGEGKLSDHSIYQLARGLLNLSAKVKNPNPELDSIRRKVIEHSPD